MLRFDSPPVFLSGRAFTSQEIKDIQETVRVFWRLSWAELVQTICEHLDWVTPAGRYKVDSCAKALIKLQAQGLVTLPTRRECKVGNKEILFGARTDAPDEIVGTVRDIAPVELERVAGREQIGLWNEYVHRYHPLRYKRPFGAHQRYFIRGSQSGRLGCLLFASSAWALAERDAWIGWSERDRAQRLNWVVANTRFLVFPWVRVKNLASKALSLAARRIRSDWQQRYGYKPVLLETFVEVERYEGVCYQAANWIRLGVTAGRGRMDRYTQYLSTPKAIYVYPLEADFRSFLRGKIVQTRRSGEQAELALETTGTERQEAGTKESS
jgi:Druantia protein DruA